MRFCADLDPGQPVERLAAHPAVVAGAQRHEPLAHVGAGADAHAEPVACVLVHDAPFAPEQAAARGLVEAQHVHRARRGRPRR